MCPATSVHTCQYEYVLMCQRAFARLALRSAAGLPRRAQVSRSNFLTGKTCAQSEPAIIYAVAARKAKRGIAANALVRLDHVARFIVNADHRIM
jgi:hypothetical protein